jgi:hypothetical protein
MRPQGSDLLGQGVTADAPDDDTARFVGRGEDDPVSIPLGLEPGTVNALSRDLDGRSRS